MRISDLLPSDSLAEMLQMRSMQIGSSQLCQNWFKVDSVACLYERFQALDADNNGSLSQQEFAG